MPLLLLPIPVAVAVTVSRRHLFDLDAVVNRSIVYGGLTAGVIVTYALVVPCSADSFRAMRRSPWPSCQQARWLSLRSRFMNASSAG